MLEKLFPNLKEELLYCAPELIWLKVKNITGLDIIDIIESINNNKCLKRKNCLDYPDKEYGKRHFHNM